MCEKGGGRFLSYLGTHNPDPISPIKEMPDGD